MFQNQKENFNQRWHKISTIFIGYSKKQVNILIGQGSSGLVRKCIERKTGNVYAIKIMPLKDE